MRKLIILIILLFGAFLLVWSLQAIAVINRPDEYADGYDESAGQWWNASSFQIKPDDGWSLADLDVPDNYIPLPGQSNLFMIVDTDGKITGYTMRIKQLNGSWKWEIVNPDIPEDYEAVDGLENVYLVVNEDGEKKYYLYIRNADDTYAFVDCDERGNPIERDYDATVIDTRHHVNITGNVYSLLNDHGVVIGYQQRVDNNDGTFSWEDLPNFDDIIDDLTAIPDETEDYDRQYENLLNEMESENPDVLSLDVPKLQAPSIPKGADSSITVINEENTGVISATPGNVTVINNADGTVTRKRILKETKTDENGIKRTTETIIVQKFSPDGVLLESSTEGPFVVSENAALTGKKDFSIDRTAVTSSLAGEITRYTTDVSFDEQTASKVITMLNAKRQEAGLCALTVTDTAVMLAKLRAADMMKFDVIKQDLPTYGSLSEMLEKFSITTSAVPGENLWKTIPKTSDEIHKKLQAVQGSADQRLDLNITQCGVAIAWGEGSTYIYYAEIFL